MSSLAFLARGRVFVRDESGATRALESPFAHTLQQQREDTHRQRALHRRSSAMGLPPQLQEQMEKDGPPPMNIRASGVCLGEAGRLLFALSADKIGGYLSFDLAQNKEQRLMHSAEFGLEHLDRDASTGLVACTVVGGDGTRAIGVMPEAGRHPDILTEGDALVMAPRWVRGQSKTLVFQSAGVARDGDGFLRERAPFEIERLNVETGALETLAKDAKHDFLGPLQDAGGALYAIRRPFSPRGAKASRTFLALLLDIALFLPRFGLALIGWANFFSWRYRGQGLSSQTAQGSDNRATGERAAPVQIRAWGEVLTPQIARGLGRKTESQEEATWVSKEWQLVKRAPGSEEWHVLAEGVLSFDVAPDGTVFFCDGGRLFRLKPDGGREKLCAEAGIESVRVLS